MKIYNNLSICALAGLFAFTSCTKEDGMEGGSVAQPFQISVSDRGFQGISDGRAVDENYKTTFVAGDVVGVYGVAGGQVVEGILSNMTANFSRRLHSMRIIPIRIMWRLILR